MKKYTPRPLPKLIALPIPEFKQHAPLKKYGRPSSIQNALESNQSETNESDVHKSAIIAAIDALQSVIALTYSFLKDVPDNIAEPEEWLTQLGEAIDFLEEALRLGLLDPDQNVTIETEGVSSLDSTLTEMPEFEEYLDETVGPFSSKLLCFWLNEIERRGWELLNICIMSVDVIDAGRTFQMMKALRYPVR